MPVASNQLVLAFVFKSKSLNDSLGVQVTYSLLLFFLSWNQDFKDSLWVKSGTNFLFKRMKNRCRRLQNTQEWE